MKVHQPETPKGFVTRAGRKVRTPESDVMREALYFMLVVGILTLGILAAAMLDHDSIVRGAL